MRSTATYVSKCVSSALDSYMTKSVRSLSSKTTLIRVGGNDIPCARPLYTRVQEFSSSSSSYITEFTSPVSYGMGFHQRHLPLQYNIYPREIVFLGGAPGAGKGTNSSYIAQLRQFSAPTIVVSELLNTSTCKLLKDCGAMIDDNFVFNVLLKELEKPKYRDGVVVDGFPRTAKQAELLNDFYNDQANVFSINPPRMLFVMLHIDESASIKRQQYRGKVTISLNMERASLNLPPLEVRATDVHEEASKARYAVFKEQLSAVMELGQQFPLVVVDASSNIRMVQSQLAHKMATLPEPY